MTLYQTPEASLTYHHATETLYLSYNATRLSVSFGLAYQRALEEMLGKNVCKLLLDLKRNAPPSDEEDQILGPLVSNIPNTFNRPIFIAAVLSEGQYQYQIGNYSAGVGNTTTPDNVEFNYFTSRKEAAAWLGDN